LRRYVRKPPRRIIIEAALATASLCISAMLPDIGHHLAAEAGS